MSYKPNFGNCSINVNRVSYLVANVTIEIVNSPMTTKTIIVEAIKRKTCVEHKPQIKIKHITNVIIDDANKHNDIYLNIQRSLKKEKMLLLFLLQKKMSYTYDVSNISKIVRKTFISIVKNRP